MTHRVQIDINTVAEAFLGNVDTLHPLGTGRINDTYLACRGKCQLVLRRINSHVFPAPHAVIANFTEISKHLYFHGDRNYIWPMAVPTLAGDLYYKDSAGEFWHAQEYIAGAESGDDKGFDKGREYACGQSLAAFHLAMADATSLSLIEPLPGFHHLPSYLESYYKLLGKIVSAKEIECSQKISLFQDDAIAFVQFQESEKGKVQVIHGDPKCDNFIFVGGRVGLIDYDTAYYGSAHIDLGDGLRSFCNLAGEDGENPVFDLGLCKDFLDGYMSVRGDAFNRIQLLVIYNAVLAIAYELGVRFFTDHLDGDKYFKTERRGENLHRAEIQFKLCQSIKVQEQAIKALVLSYLK